MYRVSTRVSLALISALAAAGAAAQAPPEGAASPASGPQPTAPTAPALASPAGAATGSLHVVVFVDGVSGSLEGIQVSDDQGGRFRTNAEGAARLQLSEGEHCVRVTLPAELSRDATPRAHDVCGVVIVGGESTQAIVTLDASGQGPPRVDLMAPHEAAAARAAEQRLDQQLAEKRQGTLRGSVIAFDTRAPVAGARVFVRGLSAEAVTDAGGRFELVLPEGSYQLSLIHSKYSTLSRDGVEVKGDAVSELELELTPSAAELDDFVVVAPHVSGGVAALMVERRASSNVTDVIGTEEMTRAGASDAAGALRRVTGINVVGGRFVYVRGMGERYSATLLNGQMIPSPDPERRVVPLDLFPTQVLESVIIQKTFSPDLPAEFGGGMVQLRTRSYPESALFQVGLSLGANTQTTFRDGPVYEGGDLDFIGTDDGTRALPAAVRDAGQLRRGTMFEPGQTDEELQALGRSMPNLWNVYRTRTPPDSRLTLAFGNRWQLGSVPFGVLASGVFSTAYNRVVTDNRRFLVSGAVEGGLEVNDEFRIESLEQTITSGGIATIGAEPLPGHELRSTTLLLRVTDDRVDLVTGYNDNIGRQVRGARLRYIERQLLSEQLTGRHTFEALRKATLEWNYAFANASLDEPDRREYFYYGGFDRNAVGAPFSLGEEPERLYTVLDDRLHDLRLAFTQPVGIWSGLEAKAKLGMTLVNRDRESDVRRYRIFTRGTRITDAVNQQAPEDILTPENFAPDGLVLGNVTDESDTYTAAQRLRAGYLMAEVPLAERFEIMGGARLESSTQNVITTSRFNPGAAEESSLENTDILPAATATWRFSDEMTLRGGFGRTVSRPEFRELANVPFYDVTTNAAFSGNPDLQRASIDNFDLRWEWYFAADELLSLGGFYKTFDKPIELVVEGGGGGDAFTWQNATSATNYGVELEGRRGLGFLADPLENFFVAFNLAYIQSDVDLRATSGLATSRQRPLQGQAPYVINAQFGFDDAIEGSGTTATLLYNVTGRWIAQVGVSGAPDIYQEPVHQIDFAGSQRLPGGFNLTLRANNLLNPKERRMQGSQVAREFQSGRSVSLGLTWAL